MATRPKHRLFIEAFPLLGDNPSGIGKLLYSLIDTASRDSQVTDRYDIILVVPLRKRHKIDKWNFSDTVHIATIPLPLKAINALGRLHIMPPIDVFLGKGIYIFPNYRRLPLANSKSLTYIHDVAYKLFPETIQSANRIFLERVVPDAVQKSDGIITLSEQSKKELLTIFPKNAEKILVVPCGIDQQKYSAPKNEDVTKAYLDGCGVEKQKYIVFVGNIEPRKNLLYTLDVYRELIDTRIVGKDTALLLIGGDGWSNDEVLSKIERLNNMGYRVLRPSHRVPDEALPSLYAQSLFAILLSLHEGFGMTPLEALASGARVIVSDIPVLHEVGGPAVNYASLNDKHLAAQQIKLALMKQVGMDIIQKKLDYFSWVTAKEKLFNAVDRINDINYNNSGKL